jgi:hypothetical protein
VAFDERRVGQAIGRRENAAEHAGGYVPHTCAELDARQRTCVNDPVSRHVIFHPGAKCQARLKPWMNLLQNGDFSQKANAPERG